MTEGAGWVLYDGSCGLCLRLVRRWGSILERRGFVLVPLQSPWVAERLGDLDGRLLDDVRLLLPSGELLSGADVYRHAMGRIWWAWPLSLLARIPGLRALFDAAYLWVARHRHTMFGTCDIEPDGV